MPWPCGQTYRITQGHGGGSHADSINRWAWDVGIGVGADVTAPADGIVRAIRMDSTRGGCDAAFVSDANYVVIDFGDGTDANFTHLLAGSSNLVVGSPVKRGDVVGKVGLSGWVCGAHLHFQFQNTCSTPACASIQADFVGLGDPAAGTSIESNNCPAAPCALAVDPAEPLVVDEKNEACFERITSYFWPVREGDGGHHYMTYTASVPDPETIGRWQFAIAEAGRYQIDVFVPETEANSTAAVYAIEAQGETVATVTLDQAANKGWQTLGAWDFEAAQASVSLADNTGEDAAKLAFDALRVEWITTPELVPPPDAAIPGVHDDGGAVSDDGAPAIEGEFDELDDETSSPIIESRGHACSSVDGQADLLLLLVGAWLWRRRRV